MTWYPGKIIGEILGGGFLSEGYGCVEEIFIRHDINTSIAKYYYLIYLVDIEGREVYKYDLFDLEDKLYKAFLTIGIELTLIYSYDFKFPKEVFKKWGLNLDLLGKEQERILNEIGLYVPLDLIVYRALEEIGYSFEDMVRFNEEIAESLAEEWAQFYRNHYDKELIKKSLECIQQISLIAWKYYYRHFDWEALAEEYGEELPPEEDIIVGGYTPYRYPDFIMQYLGYFSLGRLVNGVRIIDNLMRKGVIKPELFLEGKKPWYEFTGIFLYSFQGKRIFIDNLVGLAHEHGFWYTLHPWILAKIEEKGIPPVVLFEEGRKILDAKREGDYSFLREYLRRKGIYFHK